MRASAAGSGTGVPMLAELAPRLGSSRKWIVERGIFRQADVGRGAHAEDVVAGNEAVRRKVQPVVRHAGIGRVLGVRGGPRKAGIARLALRADQRDRQDGPRVVEAGKDRERAAGEVKAEGVDGVVAADAATDAIDGGPDKILCSGKAAGVAAFFVVHHAGLCAELGAAQQQSEKNARDHDGLLLRW